MWSWREGAVRGIYFRQKQQSNVQKSSCFGNLHIGECKKRSSTISIIYFQNTMNEFDGEMDDFSSESKEGLGDLSNLDISVIQNVVAEVENPQSQRRMVL